MPEVRSIPPKGFLSGLLGGSAEETSEPSRWDGAPTGPMGKGILCCKCEHLNPTGLEQCERCSQSLFIDCPKCRKRNARVLMHCVSCRGRLHQKSSHGKSHSRANPRHRSGPLFPCPYRLGLSFVRSAPTPIPRACSAVSNVEGTCSWSAVTATPPMRVPSPGV